MAIMDVRAILVVTPPEPPSGECFAEVPLALADIVGKSLVEHTCDRLRRFGVEEVAVVCEKRFHNSLHFFGGPPAHRLMVERDSVWSTCQSIFSDFAQAGAEVVLVQRLGAYTEVNFDHLLQFHLDRRAHVSALSDINGSLDLVAISASRRNDAAFLFRHRLKEFRVLPAKYLYNGFTNRMRHASDLRRLTCDVLLERTELRPLGKQIRPGVWAGRSVRIERGARVVAPAYLGEGARIRAAAVVTRGSSVGHHAEIDCGTIVDASSVLPFSYVGAALELANCVAGFKHLASLERNVDVEIADGKLLNVRSASASRRALQSAALFTKFVPLEMVRGIFALRRQSSSLEVPDGIAPSALQGAADVERKRKERERMQSSAPAAFENQLIVVRRYGGDQ